MIIKGRVSCCRTGLTDRACAYFSVKFSVLSRAGQRLGRAEGGTPHRALGEEPTGFWLCASDVAIFAGHVLPALWVDAVTNQEGGDTACCGAERSDAEQVGRDRPEALGGGGIERPFLDTVRVLREGGVVRHGVGLL